MCRFRRSSARGSTPSPRARRFRRPKKDGGTRGRARRRRHPKSIRNPISLDPARCLTPRPRLSARSASTSRIPSRPRPWRARARRAPPRRATPSPAPRRAQPRFSRATKPARHRLRVRRRVPVLW